MFRVLGFWVYLHIYLVVCLDIVAIHSLHCIQYHPVCNTIAHMKKHGFNPPISRDYNHLNQSIGNRIMTNIELHADLPIFRLSAMRWPIIGVIFHTSQPPTRPKETYMIYDREEPAVSYRWTGWVWEITGWRSRLQENYWSFWRNL
jgi:hypothetical protein